MGEVTLPSRIALRLFQVLFYSELQATRFTLGLSATVWAVMLLWPGDTFDRPAYATMAYLMTEKLWGVVFLLAALTQFSIIVQGNYHDKLPQVFAGFNAMLYTFVVISIYVSVDTPPAAISGEIALAFGATWVWVRSGYVLKGRRNTDRG